MPHPDTLPSWLAEHLGVDLVGCTPVGGGCIHSAWRLDLADGSRLFAKTNGAASLPLLEAEAEGLQALRTATGQEGLQVPVPLICAVAGPSAVLVLSWLALESGRSAADALPWRHLGAALAGLHQRSLTLHCVAADRVGSAFGWPRDNVIGAFPQRNGWDADWGRFFVQRRLAPQLEHLARRGTPLGQAQLLLERAGQWLAEHQPEPCLVHGDLWSGNAAICADGQGAIFDPAVYRGDREVDLAMARLFGGFPEAFFASYEGAWPLPPGHRFRRDLYNLYHLLNHANLFGGSYLGQSQARIDALLAPGADRERG
ncbi:MULTISPECIES: fructosamine kinase family protein [unclassified Cyanobium]|uniref:fructosamine kinase family protein n=1 Tax=unclassified Cyanobium TaxID=2627006 RepID=UPI0020CC5E14|nr:MULTISPECIES: fructosamine kinase family protein [unclassified Cyanobium]MCP9859536.1 fructosamine kinase family protein [Cyanobium sp. Cruz-8H5]MCP9867361.1 fructosamine kinase family protein [Cyanobium sp. Cruz-8D1]